MNKMTRILLFVSLICLTPLSCIAQMGGNNGTSALRLNGAVGKLFGDNQAFSANIEILAPGQSGNNVVVPGKVFFVTGKSRFEMDMTAIKDVSITSEAIEQIKAMGMDKMVMISRPDKSSMYLVYPGLQSYVEMPLSKAQEAAGVDSPDDYSLAMTEIGKEIIDGHKCVKNKALVTDKEGVKHEATIWNASDLKGFPIRIQTTEEGNLVTMSFKNVSLSKPASELFEAPAGYDKYSTVQAMMQQSIMKRMSQMGADESEGE